MSRTARDGRNKTGTMEGTRSIWMAPAFLAGVSALTGSLCAQTIETFENHHTFHGPSRFANLGHSVEGAGDVNRDGYDDVVVGARYASPGGISSAGSAYVYSGLDGTVLWRFDGPVARSYLGTSVSGAGDVNADGFPDVVVGTPSKIFVYSGKDGTVLWQFSTLQGSLLRRSASGAGDVNGDGFADVIVGVPGERVGLNKYAGSAIVYSGLDGTMLWRVNGTAYYHYLGLSVDRVGDVNEDGFDDVVIGAGVQASGGPQVTAFVYSGKDGTLLWDIRSGGSGRDVAGAGDVNRDGVPDLIVGVPSARPGGIQDAGSVFVYSGKDATLLWRFDGVAAFDRLGAGVDGAGDVDRDGFDDMIVNVTANSSAGVAKGSAIVYSGRTGAILWQIGGDAHGDWWGYSVAGVGDVNGDRFADVIVGAPQTDPGGFMDAGSAFVYTYRSPLASYGTGLGGSGGIVPRIGTGGELPRPGNAAFKIEITGGLGGSVAAIAGSFARAETPLAGLTLYGDFVNPENFIRWLFLTSGAPLAPGVGTATLPIPIPNDSALLGFTTYWQGFVTDPGSPSPFRASHTAGLAVTLVR